MKKVTFSLLLPALLLAGCSSTPPTDIPDDSAQQPETAALTEEVTEAPTEIPTNAPFPNADFNAVTFDSIGTIIAEIVCDDDAAASGTLSVVSVDGNNMLKFTDESTTTDNLEEAVQKVRIDVTKLLAPEQFANVYSIGFDLYAEAKSDAFVNDDGENMLVPGWIGGGGGSETADGDWYGFADFSGSDINEYSMERSDACHVTFKFLLAASGKQWDDTMTEPNFLIMRWGMQNLSDMYLDNITFYDKSGKSIPLTLYGGAPDVYEPIPQQGQNGPEEIPAQENTE